MTMRAAWRIGLLFLAIAIPAGEAGAAPRLVLPPATAATNDGGEELAVAAGGSLIGRAGPALRLHTIDGETIDLAKLYGRKPVYLKFWATWCAPCRAQMPAFEKEFESLGDKMQVVAVNTGFNDNADTVKAYRKALGIRMPIVIDDGALAKALNLRVTPQHVVIGRDGRILHIGHLEDEKLHQAFDTAIGQGAGKASGGAAAAEKSFRLGERPLGVEVAALDGVSIPLIPVPRPARSTVLIFFAPWCESYFTKTRPQSSKACRSVTAALSEKDSGARRLGIASGLWTTRADVADYGKSAGIGVPLGLDSDGQLFRTFGVKEIPAVIRLDSQGRIAEKLDAGSPNFDAALGAMMKTP
jgi:thiol-disulfide isomerase/thioredoxin